MREVILMLGVAAVGCSSGDDTIDITHDPCGSLSLSSATATDEQLAAIAGGVELWRVVGASGLSPSADDRTTRSLEVRFECAAPAFHGLYDDERSVIFLNQALSGDELAIVVAHELGHAFGLVHVTDRTSLMNAGNLTTPPTESDRAALEALWGACDPR